MRHCVDKMAVLESVLEGGQVDLLSEEAKSALLDKKILVESLKPLDELRPDIRAQAEVRRRVCADRICKRVVGSGKIAFGDPKSDAVLEKAIGRDSSLRCGLASYLERGMLAMRGMRGSRKNCKPSLLTGTSIPSSPSLRK